MTAEAERRAVESLAGWLARGAPDDAPPPLPPRLAPEELGPLYERHLLAGRRERGAYYSPPALVDALLDAVLGEEVLAELGAEAVLCDPACGGGAFLLAAARRLRPRAAADQRGAARLAERLLGLDSDGGAAAVARLALARLLELPLPAVRGVRRGDALRGADLAPGSVDLILGNPPFLGEEDHRELFAALRAGSRVAGYLQPRTDLAYLFCHLCLDLLRPGGRLGLVLPEGLLDAAGASGLRRRLLAEARIDRLTQVELPGAALFSAAPGVRCCLLALRKGPAPDHRPRVARLDGAGQRLLHRAPPQRALLRGDAALRLGPPDAEALCEAMERAGAPLGAGYLVSTGVQAGPGRLSERQRRQLGAPRAGAFVLDAEEVEALGLSPPERALLRPFYLAAELPSVGPLPPPRHFLLYLTPATCPDITPYPALRRHLLPLRPLLQQRREARLGYREYFHLHWPREEASFLVPKLLSVRQTAAPRVAFAPGPAFVDLAANVIRPRPGAPFELPTLALLLQTGPVRHYLGTRGKRKGPMLQVDGGPLSALPLPSGDRELSGALGAVAQELLGAPGPQVTERLLAEADRLAARAYCLPQGWAAAATL